MLLGVAGGVVASVYTLLLMFRTLDVVGVEMEPIDYFGNLRDLVDWLA